MNAEQEARRPTRILVADPLPVVREGLRRMLEVEGQVQVVAEVATRGVVQMALLARPDVILLGMNMLGEGALRAIRRTRERIPATPVIVLTLFGEQGLMEALRAGAAGYLPKEASREEMLRAIDRVSKGQPQPGPSVSRHLFTQFATEAQGKLGLGLSPLPNQQREVLPLASQGATNKLIASRLSSSRSAPKRRSAAWLSTRMFPDEPGP